MSAVTMNATATSTLQGTSLLVPTLLSSAWISQLHASGILTSNYYTCRPTLPKAFAANQPKTIRLYPLSNYTFGTKETQPEEDPSVIARLKRLEEHYEQHGMRRTCEGILVCHEHNHPHVLMLQIANAFFKLYAPLYFLYLRSSSSGIVSAVANSDVPAPETTSLPRPRRSVASRTD